MALYEKATRLLFHDFVKDQKIQKGDVFDKQKMYQWFNQKYPLIKPGTLYSNITLLSTNAPGRLHHNVDQNGQDDLFYQIDSQRFRLFDSISDPAPIYSRSQVEEFEEEEVIKANEENFNEENEFAYERDLQNFLAKNLNIIESGLTFYGLEYPAGNRTIDILALDKDNNYVVIELKVSRGYDRVVGQILRYMAWIRKNHAEGNQKVRGIIIAREITEDLILACSEIQNIDLFEYSLSISLKKIQIKD